MDKIPCRVCGQGKSTSLGQIPDSGEFADQLVSPAIKGGQLWLCEDCGSLFRYPTLSGKEYLSFYEQVSSSVWIRDVAQRNDFSTIYAYLLNHNGGSILDIGCYGGAFLSGIPANFRKFGLEPSRSAAEVATANGVEVLGQTLADLAPDAVFDLLVAIDVIEHVLDVERFLVDALAHVDKDGTLIVSTGDPDCFYWKRIFRARYWYSSLPEHLTFPSFKFFCEFAIRHELLPPERIRFKHINLPPGTAIVSFLRQLIFALSPALYRAYVKLRRNMKGDASPLAENIPVGAPGLFRDQQVILLKKRG